jgi:hypothetical protein
LLLQVYAGLLHGRERVDAWKKCLALAGNRSSAEEIEKLRQEVEFYEALGEREPQRLASDYAPSDLRLIAMFHNICNIRAFGLMASINDGTLLELMVDTGASGIVLRTKAAEKTGTGG